MLFYLNNCTQIYLNLGKFVFKICYRFTKNFFNCLNFTVSKDTKFCRPDFQLFFIKVLKKEQCEPSLLITANVPSAKKLIVHGPDLSQIPTQSAITEDTQFINILQESYEFFGIAESKREKHFLFDVKTNQIHVPDIYVRNFYFFRRNFSPQLSLVQMDQKEANKLLEKAAFNLKVLEESKVLFFRKLLNNTVNKVHASAAFLHDELTKLPMFPRKPLEADFHLYPRLSDRELLTTDMLHK